MGELSEQQEILRQKVRRMAVDNISPRAAKYDETEEYPWEFVELFRENRLFALMIPESYGGAGGDITSACLVTEELAKADGTAAMLFVIQAVEPAFIRLAGNSEQKKRYLTQIAEGKFIAEAMTEPGTGSDVAAIKTTAVFQGDCYLLNGNKAFCSNSKMADFIITFAMARSEKTQKGLTAFVVDKGTPGLIIGRVENKLGFRALPTGDVIFEDVRLPLSNRLGPEGGAFKAIWPAMNEARTVDAALALGLAEGALEHSVSYAKKRLQFGKPIASFQGVQFTLADMCTETMAARSLVYEAASIVQKGDSKATQFASMAKLYASDTAMKVTNEALQVVGGSICKEADSVGRLMRDAKALQIVEGTSEIQRMIIARNVLGRFD